MTDPQEYLDRMYAKRGYVTDMHRTMVLLDAEYLEASNNLAEVAYLSDRTLNRKVKELIFIVISTLMGKDRHHLEIHLRAAMEAGASEQEILEVLELLSVPAGQMAFRYGQETLAKLTNAAQLEPLRKEA